jgi:hypothetical protein
VWERSWRFTWFPQFRSTVVSKSLASGWRVRPFGATLSASLKAARIRKDGVAVWEEEDYCAPPLAQERAAMLDDYFHDLRVEQVKQG